MYRHAYHVGNELALRTLDCASNAILLYIMHLFIDFGTGIAGSYCWQRTHVKYADSKLVAI